MNNLPTGLHDLATALRDLPQRKAPPGLGRGTRQAFDGLLETLPHSRALQTVDAAAVPDHAAGTKLVPADATALLHDEIADAFGLWLGHDHAAGRAARLAAALDEWLLVLAVAALAADQKREPTGLLDGCALLRASADEAGWRVDGLRKALSC